MSDATPQLLITDIGLAVASNATPQGPFIHIVGFRVGSAYGYVPQRNQTGLLGNELYSGQATTYQNVGNNTINIVLEIPPEAGPFEFGEVGLFLADANGQFSANSAMFAVAAFDSPQTKFSSLGTNVISSYTFNCLLKLQQSVAVFQVDTTTGPPAVLDVYQWSDVYPPLVSANPNVPVYNVREASSFGDGTLLANTNGNLTIQSTSYERLKPRTGGSFFTVVNATATSITVSNSALDSVNVAANTGNRVLVVKTHAGFFRSVSSISSGAGTYTLNLNTSNDGTYNNFPLPVVPQVNEQFEIFSANESGRSIRFSQILDAPPPPALATVGNPGLAYGGSGLYMPQPGVIQAVGMLQAPSANTGRTLTASDNLNNFGLPSGLYITYSASFGYPANMPIAWDCQIWIHNNGNDVTQIAWPMNGGGGDGAGNNGYPPYWRQGYNGANWTTWAPFMVGNKIGTRISSVNQAKSSSNSISTAVNLPSGGQWNVQAMAYGMQSIYSGTQLYINGNLVDTNTAWGDSEGIGYDIMMGYQVINVGGPVNIACNANFNNPGSMGDFTIIAWATRF